MAVLWTAFIIYGLTAEPGSAPLFPWLEYPGMDKLIHIILFGVESALLVFAFGPSKNKRNWVHVLGFCLLLGGGLEIVQYFFIEGRSGEVLDLFADMLGAGLAIMLLFLLDARKR